MDDNKDKIVYIPVEDILPNRFQPRLAFDEKELNELASSILKYGVIQPIVLRKIGEKYEIIAGERRYKASCLAGLKKVPAILNNTDDNTSAEIALLENLQRKNLTPIEEAQSYKKLMDRSFTQEEIASKLGISQSSIANKLRLLNLPKKVQDALLYNQISERHARSMLVLNDAELQKDLLEKIVNERLTVKQTEEEISRILNRKNEKDIPDEIKKFIEPTKSFSNETDSLLNAYKLFEKRKLEVEEEKPEFEEKAEVLEKFIVPAVVDLDNIGEVKTEEKEEEKVDSITPFEMVKEEVEVNKESEYSHLKISHILFNLKEKIFEISENNKNIKIQETEHPDKYQIVIDIYKDAE